MTAVIFQTKANRAEVYADTLCLRDHRPSFWTMKAHVLPQEQLVVVTRGPDNFGFECYRQLTHAGVTRGIDEAVEILPEVLVEVQRDLRALMPSYAHLLDGQCYIVGRSPARREFVAYRLLQPSFAPEELPPGLHAAPGPGETSWHTPGFHPVRKIIELARVQKIGVAETHGRETIGGDLWQIGLYPNGNVEMTKVYRFPDADAMHTMMEERKYAEAST